MMQPEISFQGTGFTHVNEALNLPHNCIFIAVPKTGSNSIRSQLRQKGKPMVPGPHLNICQIRDLIYPALLRASLGKNRSFPSTLPLTDQVSGKRPTEPLQRRSNSHVSVIRGCALCRFMPVAKASCSKSTSPSRPLSNTISLQATPAFTRPFIRPNQNSFVIRTAIF